MTNSLAILFARVVVIDQSNADATNRMAMIAGGITMAWAFRPWSLQPGWKKNVEERALGFLMGAAIFGAGAFFKSIQ